MALENIRLSRPIILYRFVERRAWYPLFAHALDDITGSSPCVTMSLRVYICMLIATASALRGNTVLTELRLRGCGIDAEGTSKLAEALLNIKTLSKLDLSANTVNSEGARHLGKFSHAQGLGLCTCSI